MIYTYTHEKNKTTKPTPSTPTASGSKKNVSAAGQANSLQQNTAYLNRTLQMLEQAGWLALQCASPEEVLHLILQSDLIPVYESTPKPQNPKCLKYFLIRSI